MTLPVAFLDCETITLNRDRAEAWEVGLILPGGYEHRWFLPVNVCRADPISLDIGGYHRRHPEGNAYEESVPVEPKIHGTDYGLTGTRKFAQVFVRLTHGLHLAGAVLDYDTGILGALIRFAGYHPSWHYHLIDVENQAAGFIIGRETDSATGRRRWRPGYSEKLVEVATPPYDSGELSRAVGVDPSRFARHTAIGDCLWSQALYHATGP